MSTQFQHWTTNECIESNSVQQSNTWTTDTQTHWTVQATSNEVPVWKFCKGSQSFQVWRILDSMLTQILTQKWKNDNHKLPKFFIHVYLRKQCNTSSKVNKFTGCSFAWKNRYWQLDMHSLYSSEWRISHQIRNFVLIGLGMDAVSVPRQEDDFTQ